MLWDFDDFAYSQIHVSSVIMRVYRQWTAAFVGALSLLGAEFVSAIQLDIDSVGELANFQ